MPNENAEQNAGLDDATLQAAAIAALKESPRGDSQESTQAPSPAENGAVSNQSNDGVTQHPDREKPAGEGSEGQKSDPPAPDPTPQDLPTLKLQKTMAREQKVVERELANKAFEEELAAFRAAKKRLAEGDPDAIYDAFQVSPQDNINRWWTKHRPNAANTPKGNGVAPAEQPKPVEESPDIKALKDELKALRDEAESLKAGRATDQRNAELARLQAFLASNAQKYQFVNAKKLHEAVFAAVGSSWGDHPEDTPIETRWEKAAEFVEDAVVKEWVEPLRATEKFASLYGAKGSTQGPSAQPGKTISNNLATSAPPRALTEADLSDQALRDAAMEELKKLRSA